MTPETLQRHLKSMPASARCWVVVRDQDGQHLSVPLEAFSIEHQDGALLLTASVDLAELLTPKAATIPADALVMRIV